MWRRATKPPARLHARCSRNVPTGLKLLVCLLVAGLLATAAPNNRAVAARLAKLAKKAEDSGQTVRAYMLFAEAAARDPESLTWRANRDALEPAVKLLTKAQVETADIAPDIAAAEKEAAQGPPPLERISPAEWQHPDLAPIPHLRYDPALHDFDLRTDAKALVEQICAAYGVRALADPGVDHQKQIHFELSGADFRSALEAVTAATGTFQYPITSTVAYFAPDTEMKRNELEPVVVLTFPLPEALSEKDLIEAANSVRSLLNIRSVGWDSQNRMVMIRDRAGRAEIARSLLESLLLPRAQVSIDVQFLTVDTERSYHWGASLQTLYQFIDFGKIGGIKSVLPVIVGSSKFLTFGGGATLFGVGVADAQAFATYSKSVTQALFDATVVVADRSTANFHIGDKYPIPTSLYTGYSQGLASIYNPAPQITMEDLGLVLKLTPHISGDGDIGIDLEAEYRTLGSVTIDSVPSVAERSFKGTVNLREGEWAILAGIDAFSDSSTRNGIAGIADLPGLNQLLAEHTRDTQKSNTLLVIKPTITRLPMSEAFSPQFLLGTHRGQRILL